MYDEYDKRRDEEALILHLASETGLGQDPVPDDPKESFWVPWSLINVRPLRPLPEGILEIQDKVLSWHTFQKDVVDASGLDFRDGVTLWRSNITAMRCDAVVNAANRDILGCFSPCHACIENAIHPCAGVQMRLEYTEIMGGAQEPVRRARATKGYNLPCSYILHTVSPMTDARSTEKQRRQLTSCYRSCLELVKSMGLQTVALCYIIHRHLPLPQGGYCPIAVNTVRRFLDENKGLEVIFDIFVDRDQGIYKRLL